MQSGGVPAKLEEEMYCRLEYFRHTKINKEEHFPELDQFLDKCYDELKYDQKPSLLPQNGCFEPPGES